MDNLDDLLEDLITVKLELSEKLRITGIIANKVDLRRNLTKKKLGELNNVMGANLFARFFLCDGSERRCERG